MGENDFLLEGRKKEHLGGELTLANEDMAELGQGVIRVFLLMKGGNWHTPDEIRLAAGENGKQATEGLRRMRELRRHFQIERRRVNGEKRLWIYRLVWVSWK